MVRLPPALAATCSDLPDPSTPDLRFSTKNPRGGQLSPPTFAGLARCFRGERGRYMASSTSLPLDVVSIVVNAAVFDVPQVACMIAAPRYCPHEGRTPHLKPPLSAALQAMHDLPRLARDHPREHGPVASRQLCAMRTICHRGGAAAAAAAAAHSRAALSRR